MTELDRQTETNLLIIATKKLFSELSVCQKLQVG